MQKHLDDNQIIICNIELSNISPSIACSTRLGMSITIFNPSMDSDGSIARKFVSSIVTGLL
jgi:arginase